MCLYYLFWVKDSDFEGPSLLSAAMINEFPKFFLDDLSKIPPYREIDFAIGLL